MKESPFRKDERLRKRPEFKSLYRDGKRISRDEFVVHFAPSKGDEGKLGIVISSSLCNAVKRNRIRRIIREAYRLNKGTLKPSQDIIVRPKKSMILMGTKKAEALLVKVFKEMVKRC